MPADLIDGRAIAKKVRAEAAERAKKLAERGIKPGLAVVLVGEDPASVVYTSAKSKAAEEAGMYSLNLRLPADISQADLLARVDALNSDPRIHGILVQMPLPRQIDPDTVIRRIDPAKDVDGFHPINVGKMLIGERDGFIPCTPAGIQVLLRESGVKTPGKNCVVIGRSNIVGKPMAALMLQDNENANCTVTVCHRHTADLKAHTRSADILIVAAGRARIVTAEMVKPGFLRNIRSPKRRSCSSVSMPPPPLISRPKSLMRPTLPKRRRASNSASSGFMPCSMFSRVRIRM